MKSKNQKVEETPLVLQLPIKITATEDGSIITDAKGTEYYFYEQKGTDELKYDGFCAEVNPDFLRGVDKTLNRSKRYGKVGVPFEEASSELETFEIGKAYQHHSGAQLFICGEINSISHGKCLIAEQGWERNLKKAREEEMLRDHKEKGALLPVGGLIPERYTPIGIGPAYVANWKEIPVEVFVENNFS